ncbi:MAG: holo-ACP synthase [Eubacterium sp.]|nr:holo-ACP synthase [Eubacterium sp.]
MLVGIGVDSVEISRVIKACEKEHFFHKIFSEREREQMDPKRKRAASDFAGKEAVVKVFGTGFTGIRAGDIEILRHPNGQPYVVLQGSALDKAKELGIDEIKISITTTKELATAFAVGIRVEG